MLQWIAEAEADFARWERIYQLCKEDKLQELKQLTDQMVWQSSDHYRCLGFAVDNDASSVVDFLLATRVVTHKDFYFLIQRLKSARVTVQMIEDLLKIEALPRIMDGVRFDNRTEGFLEGVVEVFETKSQPYSGDPASISTTQLLAALVKVGRIDLIRRLLTILPCYQSYLRSASGPLGALNSALNNVYARQLTVLFKHGLGRALERVDRSMFDQLLEMVERMPSILKTFIASRRFNCRMNPWLFVQYFDDSWIRDSTVTLKGSFHLLTSRDNRDKSIQFLFDTATVCSIRRMDRRSYHPSCANATHKGDKDAIGTHGERFVNLILSPESVPWMADVGRHHAEMIETMRDSVPDDLVRLSLTFLVG